MFPSEYFGRFPAFPEDNRVFCAMPFSERFNMRWDHVIKPGIAAAGLEAYRVDLSKTSDSIPLKILRDIGTCRLVFADVTSENGARNANVMYELGIAQAVRLPEEVIVFRSDSDRLPFDIAPIFADTYHPESAPGASETAAKQVTEAVVRALGSIDLSRHLTVARIVDLLDVACFEILAMNVRPPFLDFEPSIRPGGRAGDPRFISGISRLLELGVVQSKLPKFLELLETARNVPVHHQLGFEFTPLGREVIAEFTKRYYGSADKHEIFKEFLRVSIKNAHKDNKVQDDDLERMIKGIGDEDFQILREIADLIATKKPELPS